TNRPAACDRDARRRDVPPRLQIGTRVSYMFQYFTTTFRHCGLLFSSVFLSVARLPSPTDGVRKIAALLLPVTMRRMPMTACARFQPKPKLCVSGPRVDV